MRVAEVQGFEGVGRGLTDLIRLWKRVEKSETRERAVCLPGFRPLWTTQDGYILAVGKLTAGGCANLNQSGFTPLLGVHLRRN
jgi:hypothetical protein